MTDDDDIGGSEIEERMEAVCPECELRIGDHTVRGLRECTKGLNYDLPHEDVPAGPIMHKGMEGFTAGEVSVASAFVNSSLGRLPVVRFIFTGPGNEPMSRCSLEPVNLVMDANGLKSVRTLVGSAIDRAIVGARRGR